MAEFDISWGELKKIGYYKTMKNFIMYPKPGWHVRVDQKSIGKKGGSIVEVELPDSDGYPSGVWGYRVSSFHLKRDNVYSFIAGPGAFFNKKIVQEESKYVYFVYAGSGVWQPIWGYYKVEQKQAGKPIWRPDNSEIDADMWGFACEKARWFLERMSYATDMDHGLAMGPIQGGKAHLFSQL